jgi:hypothetical protein
MFNFYRLLSVLKSLFSKTNTPPSVPPSVPPSIPPSKKGKTNDGTPLPEYVFNVKWQIMEERMNTTNLVLTVGFVGLAIAFVALFYNYYQFASTSFNDYNNRLKELNDQRFELLQKEIDRLELNQATNSATTGN